MIIGVPQEIKIGETRVSMTPSLCRRCVSLGAQVLVQKSAGARVLDIDFESLLADLEQTMMRIAAHFRLDASPASIAALASSPVLTRYSKAPHRLGFSPAHRAAMMQKARDIHAAEIRKGLALLARLQKNYPLPF